MPTSKANLNVLLKEGSRMGSGGAGARRWTMGLLVAEFALTLTLLSGAGLMLRSFLLLSRDSQVIDPSGLVTMQVRLGGQKYIQGPERRRAFYNGIQDALAAAPEIESSTLVSEIPLRGATVQSLLIDGRPKPAGEPPRVSYIIVGARYFETLGLRLLRGRPFTPLDGTPGHKSAIVNQRFVDMFFADEDPIGRRIHLSNANILLAPPPPLTIVGVSPTVRQIIFAAVAVVLAAVGIYAVTAYTVAQRTQEIGLGMALGARVSQVVGLFVRQAMRPLALGVLFGLGGALVAGRLLRTWLVKPATIDPATLLTVAALLVLIGLTAAFVPSWRGARVDPSKALRMD